MAKGISLHVGVNRPDPAAFSVDTLVGCVNDAEAMYAIAKKRGFYKRRLLVDEDATFERVASAILDAADELVAGDTFFLTFAGHGTQVTDADEEPFEGKDEAVILYDHMLIDDALRRGLWPLFEDGVRILMVADCCHSGTISAMLATSTSITVTEHFPSGELGVVVTSEVAVGASVATRPRHISEPARRRHLMRHRDFYKELFKDLPASPPIGASILLLAACHDTDTTGDALPNGKFTEALLEVWDDGNFDDDYQELRLRIENHPNLLSRSQQPQLKPTGATLQPTPFERLKPVFAI